MIRVARTLFSTARAALNSCTEAHNPMQKLAAARQAARRYSFGPHFRESALQESNQTRLQMALLQEEVDACGAALQVKAGGAALR